MTTQGLQPSEEVPLSRARVVSGRGSLLVPGLAVGGLLLLPAVGLVYAATTSFGMDETDAATSAVALDEDGEPIPSKKGKTAKTARKPVAASSSKVRPKPSARTDEAAACCAALHEAAKDSPLEHRAKLLSAATSCESATTPAVAKRRVGTQLRSMRIPLPEACE